MSLPEEPFYIQKENIYAVPLLHYNMETAAQIRLAFEWIQPTCVAVELPETMQLQCLHAASRLPDISVIVATKGNEDLFYMAEPCDAAFEALRSGLEAGIPSFCIDLDVEGYPQIAEALPDPYAITRIGLKEFYEAYRKLAPKIKTSTDTARELYMARRLKELSLTHDKVFFACGMAHLESILALVDQTQFTPQTHTSRDTIQICTLQEESCRDVMAEWGWLTEHYETWRTTFEGVPDRQKVLYALFKEGSKKYVETTGNAFPGYHLRNLMKFTRNYSLIRQHLMPDLFQILTAAKGCVDHNFAYEVWQLATSYPHLRNIDNLPALDLSIEQVWGTSKKIQFHMKAKNVKSSFFPNRRDKSRSQARLYPPGPFTICSYPPEDVVIENFGEFLKKKGSQLVREESARTLPFSTSIEDGVDTRETIRHWAEKKLYVKVSGKPIGAVGSVVIIFDEDQQEGQSEKFPWKTTWIGEHAQESDMAFYATSLREKVIGPGISRCEYGGMMMSYPPRRMLDVWSDSDYEDCRSKAEVLLKAAIDYAVQPLITYVSAKPPRTALKSYARRFGKKVAYLPIGQLSPLTINKLRTFHVLDGHDKRSIAGEYII